MAIRSGRQMRRVSQRTLAAPFFSTSARRPSLGGGSRQVVSIDPPLVRAARRLGVFLACVFALFGIGLYVLYLYWGESTPYADNLEVVIGLCSVAPAVVSYLAGRALGWVFS